MFGYFIFILLGCAMIFGGFDEEVLKIAVIIFIIFLVIAAIGMATN